MIRVLETRGAPVDRGVAQGNAHRHAILSWIDAAVRPLGWVGSLEARYESHRGTGLRLKRFLLQEHERLRGIALGAGLSESLVELAEAHVRVAGEGSLRGTELEARLDLPEDLRPLLMLRRTVPDFVGFESVELGLAPLSGCLGGVNRFGLGVLALVDRGTDQVSVRSLAQDFLLRSSDLDSGLRHLELRARAAGGTGSLLVADALGRGLRIDLEEGALRSTPASPREFDVAESTLVLDLVQRAVVVRALDGSEQRLAVESAP